MIKEAIEHLEELMRPEMIVDSEGREYLTKGARPIMEPQPKSLPLLTLNGLVDYIQIEHPECNPPEGNRGLMVHVASHDRVEVVSNLFRPQMQRDTYADAGLPEYSSFPFGCFMPIEQFIIELQSKFEDQGEKAKVLAFISSIRAETVTTADDDGVSQAVAVKNRVGRLEQAKVDPIVTLAPYRTFREVEQPASKFLLRVKSSGENGTGLPQVALFEADGGAWKIEAIKRIRDFLAAELGDKVPVIA